MNVSQNVHADHAHHTGHIRYSTTSHNSTPAYGCLASEPLVLQSIVNLWDSLHTSKGSYLAIANRIG